MRFELLDERGTFDFARALEGDALLGVRGAGGRGAKFRAAHALQPRQNFPCQLVLQSSPRRELQGLKPLA